MAVLSLLVLSGCIYSIAVCILSSRVYFGLWKNRAFAHEYPDIDPPLWRVAFTHISGLLSTVLWLLRWPSITEVWMALCLVPLLFVPYPLILNNILEWFMYLVFGNARSNGTPLAAADDGVTRNFFYACVRNITQLPWRVKDVVTDAARVVGAWWRMVWYGDKPVGFINYNYSLVCYLMNEVWSGMHHLDRDVLQAFPTPAPNSRANALMMARCATMSYDRWHNIDQAVSVNWNKAISPGQQTTLTQKYSLLKAWSFDRVIVPSDVEPLPTEPSLCSTTVAQGGAGTSGVTSSTVASSSTAVNRTLVPQSDAAGTPYAATAHAPTSTISGFVSGVYSKVTGSLKAAQGQVTDWKADLGIRGFKSIQNFVWKTARAPANRVKPEHEEFTSINTDAFLMKAVSEKLDPKTGGKVVALVLAFRGTEALQTVDWISDLSQVQPPWYALKPSYFPHGYTHQGFRDSLGLRRDLTAADGLEKFTSSYLVYEKSTTTGAPVAQQQLAEQATAGGFMRSTSPAVGGVGVNTTPSNTGILQRVPKSDFGSPFAVITREIYNTVKELGPDTKVKLFVTGHSLGGALAHLYTGALLLHQTDQINSDVNKIVAKSLEGLYTFGEPRIGSQTFVSRVNAEMQQLKRGSVPAEDRFKRVVNTLDIVTRIPPPLGELYQHPGQCTFIKPQFAITKSGGPSAAAVTAAPTAAAPAAAAPAAAAPAAAVPAAAAPTTAAPAASMFKITAEDLIEAASDTGGAVEDQAAAAPIDDKGKKKKFGVLLRSPSLKRDQIPELPAAAMSDAPLPPTTDVSTPSSLSAAAGVSTGNGRGTDDQAVVPSTAVAVDSSYSPVTNLIETPDVFLGATILTVTLKLVLSVLLLISATVSYAVKYYGKVYTAIGAAALAIVFWPVTLAIAAGVSIAAMVGAAAIVTLGPAFLAVYLLWPQLWDLVLAPPLREVYVSLLMLGQALTRPDSVRPSLVSNPMYVIARVGAFLGPAPLALLLDVLLLPVWVLFAPFLWWTVFTEPVLLLLLFAFMPPFIVGGLVDHSMAEYYTACWLTTDSDWVTAQKQAVTDSFDGLGALLYSWSLRSVKSDPY